MSSDGAPRGARPAPVTVVYLMGAGHSGSTILGLTLGNCDGFFYAGEVEEWLAKRGRARWGGSERTSFWGRVADAMPEIPPDLGGGEGANRLIERSSAALRVDLWSARRRLLPRYRLMAEQLFGAIREESGAARIIDSSHFPLRARELEQLDGVEVFLVFLVRNPQSVVASHVRALSPHEVAERRTRVLATNAGLWLTQLVSVIVFLMHPRERRLFLRHEDFLADPQTVLRALLDAIGSDAAVPDLGALDVGIPLEGNRLLGSGPIALQSSTETARRWSRFTALAQSLWQPIFARLQPALCGGVPAQRRGRAPR